MKLFIILTLFSLSAWADIPPEAIRTTDKADICTTHTGTVRNVSEVTKGKIYGRQGISGDHKGICDGPRGCEVDHRISLEVGGSNDPANLIVAPYFGGCNMTQKDVLENKLHKLICTDQITVLQAQDYLFNHWQEAYKIYINSNGCN